MAYYKFINYHAVRAIWRITRYFFAFYKHFDRLKLAVYRAIDATSQVCMVHGERAEGRVRAGNTHFTDGYRCGRCGNEVERQYDNVIRCADNQIAEFIRWIQSSDFYDNTTVVIVGDHPTMDSKYIRELSGKDRKYQRKSYVTVLNSAVSYELGRTRSYSALDMFPTTLAALGFEISGNRLGLGVNLYSDEPTLIERMGLEKLNKELTKHSKYYNRHIIAEK